MPELDRCDSDWHQEKLPGGGNEYTVYSIRGYNSRSFLCFRKEGYAEETKRERVYIRTFGYFEVFVEGEAIPFKSEKAKELLAVLVDRRGGFVSSAEVISRLWEDEAANKTTYSRCRKVALRLKEELEEHGISDIMVTAEGKRRIDESKVRCDLYDYLSGKPEFNELYRGSYMANYSWGETTTAELGGDREDLFL